MSHDPEPVSFADLMGPAPSFSTYARTIEAAQSDNERIEQLTAEVLKLRARLDALEADGNGERG